MAKLAIQAGQIVALGALGVAVQQLLAAGVYGVLAYPTGTALRVSWFDYVEEYLLWRIRLPSHAMTRVEIVANALALVVVVVGTIVGYEVIFG